MTLILTWIESLHQTRGGTVTARLPAALPVPALRAHLEWADGADEWVALVFDGEAAPLPWTPRTAAVAVAGLTELARSATP
jgi:hypothetical protein